MENKVVLVAFGLWLNMDQLEFKDADQWHVVNLRTIGGKIRHEKG